MAAAIRQVCDDDARIRIVPSSPLPPSISSPPPQSLPRSIDYDDRVVRSITPPDVVVVVVVVVGRGLRDRVIAYALRRSQR